MPTIKDVYNPLIESRLDQEKFQKLLVETGRAIYNENPDRCTSIEDGVRAAKENLIYYCQYFDEKIGGEVKDALGVNRCWVGLNGIKLP